MRFLTILLPVALTIAISTSLPAQTSQPADPTVSAEEQARRDKEMEEYYARQKRIADKRDELLAQLEEVRTNPGDYPGWAREWAGVYYCGDGLGMNVNYILAPGEEFLYTWHGCMGLYDSQIARVREVREDRVLLELEEKKDSEAPFDFIDEELIFVCWGERRYLIPKKEMQEFANKVNSGFETRYVMFPLKGGRAQFGHEREKGTAPQGTPEVPPAMAGYFLKEPVEATILEVANRRIQPGKNKDLKYLQADVVINAGSDTGLKPGMELYFEKENRQKEKVTLTKVEETKSHGQISIFLMNEDSELKAPVGVGTQVSTKRR